LYADGVKDLFRIVFLLPYRIGSIKKNKIMETKKKYESPVIDIIFIDNEISLALESTTPPDGPGEGIVFNQNNPFKEESSLV